MTADADTKLVRETLTDGRFEHRVAALAALDRLVARCEEAERVVASVSSKTALDVVAEKMQAEDRAKTAEAGRDALAQAARKVLHEYDLWAEDANDGEFAIWSRDEFMASFIGLRRALAAPAAPEDKS